MTNILVTYCNFEAPKWLLFGPNVAPLVYYSHLPIILISFFLGVYIYLQNRKSLPNKILFYTILAFVIWVLCDSIFWASNRSDVIMFVWAIDILVEPLVYIGALYLLYVLISKKDISFNMKLVLGSLYLPMIVVIPLGLAFSGFDVGSCLSTETNLSYYSYAIELFFTLWLMIYAIVSFVRSKSPDHRKEIIYITLGTILFLSSFAWGNITGSLTEDWNLAQYGLFGMPIFIAFLVYTIVKFKEFNIKLLGTQALIVAQGLIIASLLFITDISYIYTVISLSLILFLILGIVVIRGVKREVFLRESLEVANEQQANLIHFISHEVKGFLTKSRNVFSLFLEGDYGPLPEYLKGPTEEGLSSGTKGVTMVQEILSASNFKKGTIEYKSEPFDLKKVLQTVCDDQKKNAVAKGLSFETDIADDNFEMVGDAEQMTHALKNLIDNSVKYTPTGSLHISLKKTDSKFLFSVKDTGVGISPDDRGQLFIEGVRGKDALKTNVDSTGYGLFIVKKIVEAHKGKVWVDSDGPGHGSTFFIELSQK